MLEKDGPIAWEIRKCYRESGKTGTYYKQYKRRNANWIVHILRRNCLLKHVIEWKIEGRIEVTERQERRSKQLLNDLKERRGYWKLKEEALDGTLCRTRFGIGCGPVVRETAKWMSGNFLRVSLFLKISLWHFKRIVSSRKTLLYGCVLWAVSAFMSVLGINIWNISLNGVSPKLRPIITEHYLRTSLYVISIMCSVLCVVCDVPWPAVTADSNAHKRHILWGYCCKLGPIILHISDDWNWRYRRFKGKCTETLSWSYRLFYMTLRSYFD
jgi:hypothetical protein